MQVSAARWVLAMGFTVASAAPLFAQFGIARLSHTDGDVTRLHSGAPASTVKGVSLLDGDQITATDGRAEVTFRDGTILHLDTHTRAVVYGDGRVQLIDGRVFVRTSGLKPYAVDTPAGQVKVLAAAIAEVVARADSRDVMLRMVSGSGRVECPVGTHVVNAYYSATLAGTTCRPMIAQWVPPHTDEFERWASLRSVTANSLAISGTETGDAVNWGYWGSWLYGWGPYPYYSYYPPYGYPGYSRYAVPVYGTPYYSGYSSYSPYFSYSYPSYSNSTYREPLYRWRTGDPVTRPTPAPGGGTAAPPPPAPVGGMGAGAVRPKP